jgi:hypothetical protein
MANLFISYSHKDEPLRDELEVHLAMLKREGAIEVWHDRRINAGDEFDASISGNLEAADVILLLVSPDFLASRYCYDVEVGRAMERHQSGAARVVPVILRPCDWHRTPFAKLLAAPRDGKPLTRWADRDEAFLDVVQHIRGGLGCKPPAPKSPATPASAIAKPVPRSSNLRLKKEFSEVDVDRFKDEAFDHMAVFFENSLQELQQRNSGIETRFKRIDAQTFSAAIYQNGKKVARCGIRNSSGRFMGGITFSHDDSAPGNSCNENLSVEVGDQALSLHPTFGVSFGRNVSQKTNFTIDGAAEYYWEVFIHALQ